MSGDDRLGRATSAEGAPGEVCGFFERGYLNGFAGVGEQYVAGGLDIDAIHFDGWRAGTEDRLAHREADVLRAWRERE